MTNGFEGQRTVPQAIPFPEWRDLDAGQPLRQGDVLAAHDATLDPWRSLVVVLTTDCDLAKNKHAGSLTCIPVLEVQDYLLRFKFDSQRSSLLEQLAAAFLSAYRRSASEDEWVEISQERLVTWVQETNPGELSSALGITKQAATILEDLGDVMRNVLVSTPATVEEAAHLVAQAKYRLGHGKDPDQMKSQQANNLAGTINSLPGDALFLNELSEVHKSGYIAYLRRVVELRDESVTTTVRPTRTSTHFRISRLASPYVHALSQQFGAVFSAIGLPAEYETARSNLAKRMTQGASKS